MPDQLKLFLNDADFIFSNHGDLSKISIYAYGVNKPTELALNLYDLARCIMQLQR
jgi:hypothetical protein